MAIPVFAGTNETLDVNFAHGHGRSVCDLLPGCGALPLGTAWLANPLIWLGMIMLGVGERRGATVAGTAGLVCSLCGLPFALMMPLILAAYLLWVASIVLVVVGAVRSRPAKPDPHRNKVRESQSPGSVPTAPADLPGFLRKDGQKSSSR